MKVFMIGAGDIARYHGRAVVRLEGEVTGVYDVRGSSDAPRFPMRIFRNTRRRRTMWS